MLFVGHMWSLHVQNMYRFITDYGKMTYTYAGLLRVYCNSDILSFVSHPCESKVQSASERNTKVI